MNEKVLKNAHVCCAYNKEKLEQVSKCGCIYYLKIFKPELITEWCDNNRTAICPFCGIDSIIYDNKVYPITKKFLKQMKKYWF